MKKIYLLSMLLLAAFTATSQIVSTSYRGAFAPAPTAMWTDNWTNYDPNSTAYPAVTVTISQPITTNTTWTANNVYELTSTIFVKNNATLTIEPGTIIRSTIQASSLVITKGAKIIAEGTVTNPIVFTSGQNAGSRTKGAWGGIVLLGKSNYNINNGIANAEGLVSATAVPTNNPNPNPDAEYGGGLTPDENDNSGILKYVRIEYAGYTFGGAAGNELNGLTMCGVGRGTVIDYVQVSYGNDDAFEWFGGSVNCSHLVAYRTLDDDFDTDNGYKGKVQFCLAVRDPAEADSSDSNLFESDNNSGATAGTNYTTAVFANCTLIGPSFRSTLPFGQPTQVRHRRGAHLRRNSQLEIWNSIFMDCVDGVVVDGTGTIANATAGSLKFKSNIIAGTVASKVATTTAATFNVAQWFTSNNNSQQTASSGLLTMPYDMADGDKYTGLDYRPAAGSAALTGVDNTLSVADNDASQATTFSIYPNAFASTFKLNFNTTSTADALVTVYNVQGQLVETRTIEANAIATAEFGAAYASGVYLVTISQDKASSTVKAIKK